MLLESLKNYNPFEEQEKISIIETIKFLHNNTNCFDRSNKLGHITGTWLLNKDKTKTLLTHHKKLNRWLQLGGHADGEHNIPNVALREAIEESGIENNKIITTRYF